MKKFFIAFLVFLIWSFFGLWLYSWMQPTKSNKPIVVENKEEDTENIPLPSVETTDVDKKVFDTLNLTENVQKPEIAPVATIKGLKAVNENGDIIFLMEEGIGFQKNTAGVSIPNAVLDFKYKLNTYLIEHPQQELHIISYYAASENLESPNFGWQRGNKIKELLQQVGIPREKMVVKPTIKEIEFDENGNYQQGISFIFRKLDENRLKSLQFSLPENKTIYPKFVNNDIFVNDALEALLEEAKEVYSMHPNVVIELIGHTDNIGNANDNYLLALKYSRQVRWYLITKGNISRDQVIALSQGESLSIANNATERGRFLNRRIEVHYRLK